MNEQDLLAQLQANVAGAPAAPTTPALDPAVEAWIATLPAEQQDAVRQQALASMTAAPQTPVVPVAAPVVAPPQAPPVPAAPPAEPPKAPSSSRGRGRPSKSGSMKLLESCAAGGQSIENARAYLDLLAELEEQGK